MANFGMSRDKGVAALNSGACRLERGQRGLGANKVLVEKESCDGGDPPSEV